MTAEVGVAATRGEGAGAEVTINTTDEAGVAASREGEAIAAIVSCQIGGGVHNRGQDRARGVEQMFDGKQRDSLLWS